MSDIENSCKHCTNGFINELGEAWFPAFPAENKTNISHNSPKIFSTNGRYFIIFENFYPIKISACPICGRKLEVKQDG